MIWFRFRYSFSKQKKVIIFISFAWNQNNLISVFGFIYQPLSIFWWNGIFTKNRHTKPHLKTIKINFADRKKHTYLNKMPMAFSVARYRCYFIHLEWIHFYHISIVEWFSIVSGGSGDDGGYLLFHTISTRSHQLIKSKTGKNTTKRTNLPIADWIHFRITRCNGWTDTDTCN